jgi:hypothetical protein
MDLGIDNVVLTVYLGCALSLFICMCCYIRREFDTIDQPV